MTYSLIKLIFRIVRKIVELQVLLIFQLESFNSTKNIMFVPITFRDTAAARLWFLSFASARQVYVSVTIPVCRPQWRADGGCTGALNPSEPSLHVYDFVMAINVLLWAEAWSAATSRSTPRSAHMRSWVKQLLQTVDHIKNCMSCFDC